MLAQALSSIIDVVQYVGPFLIVLGLVVFVHEFGHFWIARQCGVKIETFSIGFGPEIFAWHDKTGTRWRLAWIPLGGYVQMFGDADPSSFGKNEEAQELTEEEKKIAFFSQGLGKRFSIVAAGPTFNYLFAIALLALLYGFSGQPYTSTEISDVLQGSAAEKAGILPGDKILSVDGKSIPSFEDLRRVISMNSGTPALISLERGGIRKDITVTPDLSRDKDRFGGEHLRGKIGVVSTTTEMRELSPLQALITAAMETYAQTENTLKGISQMILGVRSADEIGGPLRIAEMSGKIAREGLESFLWFIAVISINLGLINLFPIPLLDGGHLAFYVAEGIKGSPLNEKVQDYGARVGLALVASLMLFATWNDLVHLEVFSFFRSFFS